MKEEGDFIMQKKEKPAWHEVKGMTEDQFAAAAREAEEKYGDIIDLPHPLSKSHTPMPQRDRAAQFAPFAALNGFSSKIRKAARRSGMEQEKMAADSAGSVYGGEPEKKCPESESCPGDTDYHECNGAGRGRHGN